MIQDGSKKTWAMNCSIGELVGDTGRPERLPDVSVRDGVKILLDLNLAVRMDLSRSAFGDLE